MPADRAPNIEVPFHDPKTGQINQTWYRFLSSIAAQFSGAAAPVMPVDAAGVLSIASAQARPPALTEAAVIEAAQRIIAALPRSSPSDGDTRDLSRIAQPAAQRPIDSSALDLAAVGNRPTQHGIETSALDLATVALSRMPSRQNAQTGQIVVCTQPTFPAVNTLTAGTFVYVSDYAHWIYWDGTSTSFADGGNDYYVVAPSAPAPVGWHAVDGSTVSYLNHDGTTTAKTLQNVAGTPAYLKVGSGADSLNAATAPGISGSTATGNAAIAPVNSATGYAQVTGNTATDTGAGQVVQSGSGVTVAAHTHVHAVSPATAPDSGHSHLVSPTDSGHAHGKGTLAVDTTGQPENFYSQLWFRL